MTVCQSCKIMDNGVLVLRPISCALRGSSLKHCDHLFIFTLPRHFDWRNAPHVRNLWIRPILQQESHRRRLSSAYSTVQRRAPPIPDACRIQTVNVHPKIDQMRHHRDPSIPSTSRIMQRKAVLQLGSTLEQEVDSADGRATRRPLERHARAVHRLATCLEDEIRAHVRVGAVIQQPLDDGLVRQNVLATVDAKPLA